MRDSGYKAGNTRNCVDLPLARYLFLCDNDSRGNNSDIYYSIESTTAERRYAAICILQWQRGERADAPLYFPPFRGTLNDKLVDLPPIFRAI